jgi:beta-galactosidase
LPDRTSLAADGSSLSHLEIRVVDAAGRRVVSASSKIAIQATGAGQMAAIDSADPADVTPVSAGERNAFEGRVLAIARASRNAGTMTIRASAPGLKDAEVKITVR